MLRECGWCGVHLGGSTPSDPDAPVSHGICASCERSLLAQLGVPLHRFLTGLDVPVLVVDVERGGRVTEANRPALDATTGSMEAVRDHLLGDVFECAHASLEGGCGLTVHCSGCAIRKAVERTWETGIPRIRVPATLRPRADGVPPVVCMEISTERMGGKVVLRIDRLSRPDQPQLPSATSGP